MFFGTLDDGQSKNTNHEYLIRFVLCLLLNTYSLERFYKLSFNHFIATSVSYQDRTEVTVGSRMYWT
jgi:hypothetical protein